MKINSSDIGTKYGAILSEKIISPSEITENIEWLKNALLPLKTSENIHFCKIKCIFLFQADTPDSFEKTFSQFCKDIKECDLKFDDITLNYHSYIGTVGDYEQIGYTNYLVEIEWVGYKYGDAITETSNRLDSKTINVPGNIKTPSIVEITPSINLINLVITGLSDDPITIKNLTAGNKVIIDGEAGTVLQGGVNKFSDTDMWEFPKLTPGANTITFSQVNCDINIKYKPRWI